MIFRYIAITILFFLSCINLYAQDIRHEFTDPDDSVKLQGLRLYLEIDSVYEVSDSSGVKFALEMVNEGDKLLKVTNPIYDTKLRLNFSLWGLPSKTKVFIKEISRWPYPHYAKDIKPYRLEKVIVSDKEIAKDQYITYWEMDTLSIKPGEQVRYEINLFEQVLADDNNTPYFEPLFRKKYYSIFDLALEYSNMSIASKPLRFKMRLK